MKKLLNTIFVTTQGAYLAKDGETVAVRVEEEVRLRVPVHTLAGIVCFGRIGVSPALMGMCGDRGVALTYLTEHGKFLARVVGPVNGNVLLRREQYRRADNDDQSTALARAFITGKVANARTVVQRALRDHGQSAHPLNAIELETAASQLAATLTDLTGELDLDKARGLEGEAGRIYFNVFNHMITSQKEEFTFTTRSRRPPLDNVNALLSFIYTLLAHDTMAACESVGLDPAVGFLHRDRPGRMGLALDLMEELRPVLADRLVLSLINRRQVKGAGFKQTESGAVIMNDATRKEVLLAWQKRKMEEIQHPFLDEKIAVGLIPYAQALLLSRHLRGDLDGYPPYLWK